MSCETLLFMSFCHDPLGSVPVYDTLENTTVGVVKLIIGILYFVMMFITIGWVKMNEKKVRMNCQLRVVGQLIIFICRHGPRSTQMRPTP